MNGAPWTFKPGDTVTIITQTRFVLTGTIIEGFGPWVLIHGITAMPLSHLYAIGYKIIPRQKRCPAPMEERV